MRDSDGFDQRGRDTAGKSAAEVIPSRSKSRGFPRRQAPWFPGMLLLLAAMLALPNCGGGGGGSEGGSSASPSSSTPAAPAGTTQRYNAPFLPSDNFDQVCADPSKASPVDPAGRAYDRPAVQGTAEDENNWLRSFFHETYLWYDEVEDKDPACCTTPEYFEMMKISRDRFSWKINTKDYLKARQGVRFGYGFDVYLVTDRGVLVRYVEPSSPADRAGLKRGMLISHIDGRPILSADDYLAALPRSSAPETHEFTVLVPGESGTRSLTMTSAEIVETPVQLAGVLTDRNSGRKVGYMLFNRHIPKAEDPLIASMEFFARENVNDLVVDLRYNSGGAVFLASQLAFMVAGPGATANKVFERNVDNGKGNLVDVLPSTFLFIPVDSGDRLLPSLGLGRVFVLTTRFTASASEAFINGLRGIDVEVILIGRTTSGKALGSVARDNCGTTYNIMQWRGVNAKGFGSYDDGFQPTCVADDNPEDGQQLAMPQENMLGHALYYISNGRCFTSQELEASLAETPSVEQLPGLSATWPSLPPLKTIDPAGISRDE